MSIQHFNEARAIARTAKQLGAPLPKRIADALAHLDDLSRNTLTPPRPGAVAADLAQHLGNPAAMDKALKAAATELASADAAAKVHGFLADACGARVRAMMRTEGEQIATSFGEALADDLATLSRTAGLLPEWFTPKRAADLDPATFEAWTQARDAYARIQSTETVLAPLYASAIGTEGRTHFPITAAASLRFTQLPKFSTARDAYAFRDALTGRADRTAVAAHGATFVDGLFIPTALAHLGSTFEWATPAEVTERARVTQVAMTRRNELVD